MMREETQANPTLWHPNHQHRLIFQAHPTCNKKLNISSHFFVTKTSFYDVPANAQDLNVIDVNRINDVILIYTL